MSVVRLSTLKPVANYLLDDALQLDNELSAWAATYAHGPCGRYKETIWAHKILYKFAQFHGVYIKFRHENLAENFTRYIKCVFLIVTTYTTSHCSVINELKLAILQWTNKDPATVFTCMRERYPRVPGWKDDRMAFQIIGSSTGCYTVFAIEKREQFHTT